MAKIIVKNAVKRKTGWLYFIDVDGNLCGYDLRKRMKQTIKKKKKKRELTGKEKFNRLYPGRKLR